MTKIALALAELTARTAELAMVTVLWLGVK